MYTEQLLDLHRGQGMEIYWRDNFQCPSEDEYKEMTIKSEYKGIILRCVFPSNGPRRLGKMPFNATALFESIVGI